jgi:hypothetical protein
MPRKIINNTLAVACTLALLFAVAMGVEAQTDDPLFEDDIVCSIQSGNDLWVAPVLLRGQLETHLGCQATVEPLSSLLQRIPPATQQSTLRFEGGYPSGTVAVGLSDLGYTSEVPVPTELVGAKSSVVRSA